MVFNTFRCTRVVSVAKPGDSQLRVGETFEASETVFVVLISPLHAQLFKIVAYGWYCWKNFFIRY